MSDAERRDIAEALFAPKQSREEIRDAIRLESEACGYGQKPIPSEELAPVAQSIQRAQTRRVTSLLPDMLLCTPAIDSV
jgi:hypothetical protein